MNPSWISSRSAAFWRCLSGTETPWRAGKHQPAMTGNECRQVSWEAGPGAFLGEAAGPGQKGLESAPLGSGQHSH